MCASVASEQAVRGSVGLMAGRAQEPEETTMRKLTALLAATFITASCGLAMAQGAGGAGMGGGGGGGAAGGAGGEPPRRSDANPPAAVRQQLPSTVRGDDIGTDPGAMRSGTVSGTRNGTRATTPGITTKRSD